MLEKKINIAVISCLLSFCFQPIFADTFKNRTTGKILHGYMIQRPVKAKTTLAQTVESGAKEIDLSLYEIERDSSGRRNSVIVIPIKNAIDLECETLAFEKAIKVASNQGPLFIIIELDTPGGRVDLAKRICNAIDETDNCTVAAFTGGGEMGGAYSAGAMIALACEKIFMCEKTSIGAAALVVTSDAGIQDAKAAFGETIGAKYESALTSYFASLAQAKGRPVLLAKAMVNKDTEVIEVSDNGQTLFIDPAQKLPEQSVVRQWNFKGDILTLPAQEAVHCGIADQVVISLKDIVASLGDEKTKIIYNSELTKARSDFERTKRTVESSLSAADLLAKQVDSYIDEFNRYSREVVLNKSLLDIAVSFDESNSKIRQKRQQLQMSISNRESARRDLLSALSKMIGHYNCVKGLGKQFPDLHLDIEAIDKNKNSAQAKYDEARQY